MEKEYYIFYNINNKYYGLVGGAQMKKYSLSIYEKELKKRLCSTPNYSENLYSELDVPYYVLNMIYDGKYNQYINEVFV